MLKLFKRSRTNPLQPQSVNPRQGTVSPRLSASRQSTSVWWIRHKVLLGLIMGGIIIAALVLTSYIVLYKWLVITHIEVNQQVIVQPTITTANQVQDLLSQSQQQSLVLINDQQLSRQIQDHFADIAQVYVTKRYPSTLIVDYIPHVPLAQLKSPTSTFLVNRQGKVFAEATADKLPQIITSDDKIAVGQNISAQGLTLALALVESMPQTTPAIKSITISDLQLDLVLDTDPQIIIGQQQTSSYVLTTIQDLLNQFAEQQRTPKVVDLRFDRPVLRY